MGSSHSIVTLPKAMLNHHGHYSLPHLALLKTVDTDLVTQV